MFVWDRFLFEGEIAVYRSCLAAFWCLREHLLAEGLQGVSIILQDPSKLVTTANFEAAYSRFFTVDYHVLSKALHQVGSLTPHVAGFVTNIFVHCLPRCMQLTRAI
jgi:hypothetical protein